MSTSQGRLSRRFLVVVVLALVVIVIIGFRLSPATTGLVGGEARAARSLSLRPVLADIDGTCQSAGSNTVFASRFDMCLALSTEVIRLSRFKSVRVMQAPSGAGWVLRLELRPSDAEAVDRLTQRLVGLPSPRCDLAFILDPPPADDVLQAPQIEAALKTRNLDIAAPTEAEARSLQHELLG